MPLGGAGGDDELGGDRLVGEPLSNELQHFDLTRTELCDGRVEGGSARLIATSLSGQLGEELAGVAASVVALPAEDGEQRAQRLAPVQGRAGDNRPVPPP